jgi:hypothetical protein
MDELLTSLQAARRIGCTAETILQARRDGLLNAEAKQGASFMFRLSEVHRWHTANPPKVSAREHVERKRVAYINDPKRFNDLSPVQREDVLLWINDVFTPQKMANTKHTSYGYKHHYAGYRNRQGRDDGLGDHYLSNGAFKGAMLHMGYAPVERTATNWVFCVMYRPHKEV